MKTYYKVLTLDPEFGLISANYSPNVAERLTSGTIIQYTQNIWTHPKLMGSNLFVFEDKESAIDYIDSVKNGMSKKVLYECEVENPSCMGIFDMDYFISCYNSSFLKKLKAKNNKEKYRIDYTEVPRGTIFCDAIKLTKDITSDCNIL